MGTRADFYVGAGPDAEWLGSIAWDGYPGVYPKATLDATDEQDYRHRVMQMFAQQEGHATIPSDGWPWPWTNSQTTDYAYAFFDDHVWCSSFGHAWFDPTQPEPQYRDDSPKIPFPDMTSRQRVTLGPRSGLIIFGGTR